MRKLSIIGLFDSKNGISDGQTVKTNILTEELELSCGKENVHRINTYGWKKHPFRLLFQCIVAVWKSDNVMFLTDEGGIKVFPRLLQIVNLRKRCKIQYYVVGGWLDTYLNRSKSAIRCLKTLDAIYVEIPAMQRELEKRGFQNVVLVNKFRRMTPVDITQIEMMPRTPFKLCYFSRVMREKGVETCIEATKLANERAGYAKYILDIFGPINPDYQEEFKKVMQDSPNFVNYKGVVDFHQSGSVLKDYFVMLFPTQYASEGYPNVVVDAFAAGLPVVATRWNYNEDIIHDGEDGILTDVGNVEQIVETVENLADDLNVYGQMRINCLARCSEYLPQKAIEKVVEHFK